MRFAGHCDDMPAAMMLADAVVSASILPEPFGRTVIEAQAMGRPVVATDHGGAAETVEHLVTGWRVPPGDAAALAGALGHALQLAPEHRQALGERARAAVCERYTTAAMQAATLEVYQEVLASGPLIWSRTVKLLDGRGGWAHAALARHSLAFRMAAVPRCVAKWPQFRPLPCSRRRGIIGANLGKDPACPVNPVTARSAAARQSRGRQRVPYASGSPRRRSGSQ